MYLYATSIAVQCTHNLIHTYMHAYIHVYIRIRAYVCKNNIHLHTLYTYMFLVAVSTCVAISLGSAALCYVKIPFIEKSV